MKLARSAVLVTAFSVAGQLVGLLTQVVIAGAFGARADMDALLAAMTLPQYAVAVVVGALSGVLVPVFLEARTAEGDDAAWRLASAVVSVTAGMLVAVALAGILVAGPLLRLTTPGLSDTSLALAVDVARITWPTVAASGLVGLATAISHASGRFGWVALVPALGALVNLVLVWGLAPRFGVVGVAVAGTVSLGLQAVLVLRGLAGRSRLRLSLEWRHPGVARVAAAAWPLLASALLVRYTPIVDRFVASGMSEGAIAQLGYAFRLVSFLSLFLSSGIAAVVFPRMAFEMAAQEPERARRTFVLALQVMWLGVAPVVVLGMVLGVPLIEAVFERGAFLSSDTIAVAWFWQIYLLSLVGACLGTVTGRAFYAVNATRTLAIAGGVEALAYAVYTPALAARLGAAGVAMGYVVYYTLSLGWQIPVLLGRLGGEGGGDLMASLVRTTAAAGVAGAAAWFVSAVAGPAWGQLALGAAVASPLYVACLWWWGGREVRWVAESVRAMSRPMEASHG